VQGIASGVVVDWVSKHLGPDHSSAKLIELSIKRMSNDELEKTLGAFATCECAARQHLLDVAANQFDLLSEYAASAGTVETGTQSDEDMLLTALYSTLRLCHIDPMRTTRSCWRAHRTCSPYRLRCLARIAITDWQSQGVSARSHGTRVLRC
jgi:hypothetical protein